MHYEHTANVPLLPAQGENLAWRFEAPSLSDNGTWEENSWSFSASAPANNAVSALDSLNFENELSPYEQMTYHDSSKLGCGVASVEEEITNDDGTVISGYSQYAVCRYNTYASWDL